MQSKAAVKRSAWPIGIVLFFVLLTLFNIYFFIIAQDGKSVNFDQSPYESGIAYQEIIDAEANLKSLGFEPKLSVSRTDNGNFSIKFYLAGDPKPNRFSSVSLSAIRPSDKQLDTKAELNFKEGAYQCSLRLGASGLWYFKVSAKDESKSYFFESKELIQ